MLPPPSPRHNNAESKKQAQESVRFLHSYACSGIVATASPHCAHRRYPQALSVLVREVPRKQPEGRKEGRIPSLSPSLGRAHPGQGQLPAAHRALRAAGIKQCWREAEGWAMPAEGWAMPAALLAWWGPR